VGRDERDGGKLFIKKERDGLIRELKLDTEHHEKSEIE